LRKSVERKRGDWSEKYGQNEEKQSGGETEEVGEWQRSKLTKTYSFETWKPDLAIIKAERYRQRIIAIRKTLLIICILLMYWYSGNIVHWFTTW